jgi:hypothetical protein
MNHEDYDANHHLEVLPGDSDDEFAVFLFDRVIGEGATVDAALDDARANIRRWTEEP